MSFLFKFILRSTQLRLVAVARKADFISAGSKSADWSKLDSFSTVTAAQRGSTNGPVVLLFSGLDMSDWRYFYCRRAHFEKVKELADLSGGAWVRK